MTTRPPHTSPSCALRGAFSFLAEPTDSSRSRRPDRTDRTPPRARARGRRDWKPAFLEALAVYGVVQYAADAADVTRSTVYEARETDEAFAAAWDAACEESDDRLEQEAYRRAAEGAVRPLLYQGQVVEVVQEYSDTLLMFLLKNRRRDRFGDQLRVDGELKPIEVKLSFAPEDE